MISMLGGLTGIGKTFVLLNLARAFMTGEPAFGLPGWSTEKCRVLIIDKELHQYTIGPRIKGIFQDVDRDLVADRFRVIVGMPEILLSSGEWVKYLRDYVAAEKIDVLMLDPIGALFLDQDQHAQYLIQALREIMAGQTSIILAHHFSKPPKTKKDKEEFDEHSHYNFRGSVGTLLAQASAFSMTFVAQPAVTLVNNEGKEWKSWRTNVSVTKTSFSPLITKDFELDFNVNDDQKMICVPQRNKVKPLTQAERKRFGVL